MCVPLVMVYPLMKRVTNYPQAWLGICFNWGVLMGFTTPLPTQQSVTSLASLIDFSTATTAFANVNQPAALSLFASAWCWVRCDPDWQFCW